MPTKEDYQRYKNDPEYKKKKYECDRRYREKYKDKIRRKRIEDLKNKTPNKKCKACNALFFSYGTLSKFCSRNCFFEDSKTSRKGENNPAYRNGLYKKGIRNSVVVIKQTEFEKARKEIREEIIKNYDYLQCQNCGTSDTLRWEMHHIIFRSEAPRHENLHNKKNLILCCIKCHNYFHKKKSNRDFLVKERELSNLFPELLYLKNI